MFQNVSVKDKIINKFYPVHSWIRNQTYSQFVLKGGRGSTKSSFTAIEVVLSIINDEKANAICIRKVADTIRDSVYSNIVWAIDILGLSEDFKCQVSPAQITFMPTGQKILFKGLDKPEKLKSIKLANGYFKILWFEEGTEFKGMEELRNVEQSVLRGGDDFIEFITFNPHNDPLHWLNKEAELVKPNRIIYDSNYLDVPVDWLGKRFFEDAEYLKEVNPLAYDNEYMGFPVGNNEAIIFSGKYEIREFEVNPDWLGGYYGVDWGFANDPTCLIELFIEELPNGRNNLYISNEIFGQGVELDDIPSMFDKLLISRRAILRADCSRPETISHIKNKGFNILAADKWAGSIEDGITFLKSFNKIIIHTRCKEMQKEARLYSYKIDKLTKDIKSDTVDKFNHGWDAIRYALSPMIKRRGKVTEQRLKI